ncbi:HD domain-containing protein [Bacillus alkalicellulosilyticus]|uniref:HD domain-containing protein n=1 Tax=Alkalihalobacterium alkalicellulosilyticum TaxID=1912214 RepID=UPI000996DAEF|nr:HD domain-containing protein [Bacillus alkalicellulosilyticus]
MNKEEIVNRAINYVKAIHDNEKSGHDWYHVERVTKLAETIAREEQADEFTCKLAALFHDVPDEKLVDDVEAKIEEIDNWLTQHGVESGPILDIIKNMSFKGGQTHHKLSLEGQVVQDADRLDAIGAIGIARTFVYAGHKGDLMYDPELPFREEMTAKEYREGKSTAINHFYEKLLKLKGLMNTDTGKNMAEQRHSYMVEFLNQFTNEWNGIR